ncbi:hypothetical protein KGA63_005448 [Escherichia coli]|nr:hypothetical protein [Escherichia coli]EHM3232209.1 hypothetical protein [Escherichia coli]
MKKTLIALAVAASAAVSGSAMAWTQNGIGGSVDFSGTLNPKDLVTPWEVKTGAAVTGLNADITKGQSVINIAVDQAIPVLGIRTQTAAAFPGQANGNGLSPQIDFNGAVDVGSFINGVTTLTLNVTDADGVKTGTMSAPFLAAAGISRVGKDTDAFSAYVYSDYAVSSFTGGLGASSEQVLPSLSEVISRLNAIDSEFSANFNQQGAPDTGAWRSNSFDIAASTYSGFYGSGIERGKAIKITLDQAASGDAPIQWKASLPVTVSYQ